MTAHPGLAGVASIDRTELHGSLQDPVLGSVSFLNEIMSRYPEAISFAPGAPHPASVEAIDVTGQIERFIGHLQTERGFCERQARRLLAEYGPSRGLINGLIAEALRKDFGITVPAASVVVTVGAQEAMLLTLRALCDPSRDVLAVVDPSFVGIIGAARLLDLPLAAVEETGDGIDLDRLQEACRSARLEGRRLRALYIAPDFANPSGTVLSSETRFRLLELADEEDFFLIEDSTYAFTAAPEESLPSLKAGDRRARVIQLGTFAKVALPGARVGYVVADQIVRSAGTETRLLADELAALKTMVTVNTSPIGQAVVGGLLLEHGGSIAALGRSKTALYRRNLHLLNRSLDEHLPPGATPGGVSRTRPSGGFFVRMTLPVTADSALLEKSASEFGVLWTPMAQFHLGGGGSNEIRLSCSYLEPDQIDRGAARLAEFVRALAP